MSTQKRRDFARQVPEEWEYFQEWARKFDTYPTDKRYGILIMGSVPCEENMMYAADPLELRNNHIDYLIGHPELLHSTCAAFVRFLQWLEKMEGKKSYGPDSPQLSFT